MLFSPKVLSREALPRELFIACLALMLDLPCRDTFVLPVDVGLDSVLEPRLKTTGLSRRLRRGIETQSSP